MHGGSAPQVKAAAAERLKEMQHPAIEALAAALTANKEDAADHAVRSRTGLAILDRTGLGPHSTVNVEGSLGERLAALDGHDSD